MKMPVIHPYLIYLYRKYGQLVAFGLILFLIALVLLVFNQTIQRARLANMQAELAQITDVNKLATYQKATKQPFDGIEGVMTFHDRSTLLTILENVQIKAKNNRIDVDRIKYTFSKMPSINAISYELTFPASGKYLDFRRFISQLTRENNGVVLQHIALSRDNRQVSKLDGVLEFAVYVKNK